MVKTVTKNLYDNSNNNNNNNNNNNIRLYLLCPGVSIPSLSYTGKANSSSSTTLRTRATIAIPRRS
eukprot:scaffold90684_cov15-Prasinocladus_malaysianus.AAC.1